MDGDVHPEGFSALLASSNIGQSGLRLGFNTNTLAQLENCPALPPPPFRLFVLSNLRYRVFRVLPHKHSVFLWNWDWVEALRVLRCSRMRRKWDGEVASGSG